ncbi:hypothetical protein EC957_010942 [Mortierella hygrophila]|uniref:Uncharacterized protein n=1 Tax=Mortierella hygrophila TaxID=979708 RepID=A0A9P6F9T7_9FUNG|nr:hypothetical protein EC957_010942 [Mortierella hygrophila]
MTTETMPHVDPSETKNTSELDTNRKTSETLNDGNRVLLQEEITNTYPSTARYVTASTTTLETLTFLGPEAAMPETEIRNDSILYLASPENDHRQQRKDRVATAPCTPDKLLSSKQEPHPPSPVTPIPVVVARGIRSRRPSLIVTTDRHASNNDRTGQEDRITLATVGDNAVERSLTECPAFDPEPLADLVTEHRSTTVKKFHGIIQQLDAVNAELQWMLSEYLTQQYEQIEEILDSNHKTIALQEKDQELLQEQILSFLNAMKSAFAIFGGKDS